MSILLILQFVRVVLGGDLSGEPAVNISCELNMTYFDNHADDWLINVSIFDDNPVLPLQAVNDTQIVRVLPTSEIEIGDDVLISWVGVNPGTDGGEFDSINNLTINNTGNSKYDSAGGFDGNLKMQSYPLNGSLVDVTHQIPADKFLANSELATPCTGATRLSEGPTVTVGGSALYNGDLSLGGEIAQEKFRFCLDGLYGLGIAAQPYSTTDGFWVLEAVLE
jgi:hypothetical protein